MGGRVVCPECGRVSDGETGFCVSCGRAFDGPAGRAPSDVRTTGDPVADGFSLMASGSLAEASNMWAGAVRGGHVPDDDEYARMVSSWCSCLVSLSASADVRYRRSGSDLSNVLPEDRDLCLDILSGIRSCLDACTSQVVVVNLSTNYMFAMIDCFNVYTDLNDLLEVCSDARGFLALASERAASMSSDGSMDHSKAELYIGTNVEFASMLEERIATMIGSAGPGLVDRLSDHWSSVPNLPYVQDLVLAFNMTAQTRVAGRFMGRMIVKTRDTEMEMFTRKYMSGVQ